MHGGVRTGDDVRRADLPPLRLRPGRSAGSRLTDGRIPRFAQALEPIGGKLYSAGGANDGGDLRSLEIYDPGPRPLEPREADAHRPQPRRRRRARRAALRDRRAAPKGENLDVVERYDPSAARWVELRPIGIERSGFRAVTVGDSIVAFGGEELGGGRRSPRSSPTTRARPLEQPALDDDPAARARRCRRGHRGSSRSRAGRSPGCTSRARRSSSTFPDRRIGPQASGSIGSAFG